MLGHPQANKKGRYGGTSAAGVTLGLWKIWQEQLPAQQRGLQRDHRGDGVLRHGIPIPLQMEKPSVRT